MSEPSGNIAPDKLGTLIGEFHALLCAGIPPKLAYSKVCIDFNLSVLEMDELWECLKAQADQTTQAMQISSADLIRQLSKSKSTGFDQVVAKMTDTIRRG